MNWWCHLKIAKTSKKMAKNGKKAKKWPSTYIFNSSYNFRDIEKFIIKNFGSNIKLKMLFYKCFSSFLFDLAVWCRLETTYWLWLNIP